MLRRQPDAEAKPAGLPLALLQRGLAVLTVDRFSTGDPAQPIRQFLFDLQPHGTPGAGARPADGLRGCRLGGGPATGGGFAT